MLQRRFRIAVIHGAESAKTGGITWLITVMQRYELKYLLSEEQTEFLVEKLKGHMEADKYGENVDSFFVFRYSDV
jgi:hypothetical protein